MGKSNGRGHSCLISIGLILAVQHLVINALKSMTFLRCRNITCFWDEWVPQSHQIRVSWDERGMDPAKSGWGRDPQCSDCFHTPSEDGVMCWQLGSNMKNKGFWRNFEPDSKCFISLYGAKEGWGLGLLWVYSGAWESCFIGVPDLFLGFCNIFFCLPFLLSNVLLNSDLRNSFLYTCVYELGLV